MPKFQVGNCIKWGSHENLCIMSIDTQNKLYNFVPSGSRGIEEIDNGNPRLGINAAVLIGGRKKQKNTDLFRKKRRTASRCTKNRKTKLYKKKSFKKR